MSSLQEAPFLSFFAQSLSRLVDLSNGISTPYTLHSTLGNRALWRPIPLDLSTLLYYFEMFNINNLGTRVVHASNARFSKGKACQIKAKAG